MKKNYSALLFSALVIIFFSGCVTSSIESGESNNVKGPYNRMYILIAGSQRADKFIEGFAEKIRQSLSARNMEVEIQIEGRLSLETQKETNNKINDYKPEVVLIMRQTEAIIDTRFGFGASKGSMAGIFDLKLFSNTEKRPVWRANLKVYGEFGISTATEKTAKKFLSLLEQDNIIRKLSSQEE